MNDQCCRRERRDSAARPTAMRRGIGVQMLAARKRARLTQSEVARRMGTKRTSVSRAEAGRTRASIDYLERFARALGEPMSITFGGPTIPSESERWERASLAYKRLFKDHRGIYPTGARSIGLTGEIPIGPTQLYRNVMRWAALSGSPDPFLYGDPKDLSRQVAVASIWYDEIDWAAIKERIATNPRTWRADITVRMKARRVIAARGP
jgi:transcriptional regulator with XRE-family HTH domain